MRRALAFGLLASALYLVTPSPTYAHEKFDCSIFRYPKKQVLSLESHADLLYRKMNSALRNLRIDKKGYNLVTPDSRWVNFSFGLFTGSYQERKQVDISTNTDIVNASAEINFMDSYLHVSWAYSPETQDYMVNTTVIGVDIQCPKIWKDSDVIVEEDKANHREYQPKVTPELRRLILGIMQKVGTLEQKMER